MKETVEVQLWSGLQAYADGNASVRVQANTIGQMLDALVAAHPGLADVVEQGVSVSVDSRVIASSVNEPVRAGQEIVLMARLRGG